MIQVLTKTQPHYREVVEYSKSDVLSLVLGGLELGAIKIKQLLS